MARESKRTELGNVRREQFELQGQLASLARCPPSRFTMLRSSELIDQWLRLSRYSHQLWNALFRARVVNHRKPSPAKLLPPDDRMRSE